MTAIPETPTIEAFLEEGHLDLARRVGSFARNTIGKLPSPPDDRSARRQAVEILRLLGDSGWCRYAAPAPGASLDLRACCLIREALAAASPLADAVFGLQCLGTMPIWLAGSDEQKARWLPQVAQGQAMAAFALTEPEAGSDVASIATRARRDAAGYRLDGGKHLISNAGLADFYTVFASTKPEAGSRGLSCFLVPSEVGGVRFVDAQLLSTPRPLGEIVFDGCLLPAEALVGAEGDGFKIAMQTFDRLRPTVGAAACGMAARAISEAVDHAKRRRQFGLALAAFQLIQEKLARMVTDAAAARLLVYRAAWGADRSGAAVTLEAAMAKLFATEVAQRVVDDAVQILGGAGVLAASPVDRLYRSVRALRIYEGTSEIQHLIIARRLLKQTET